MLRIHDILVWIRIRIRGLWLWLIDPDPDLSIFIIDLQDANKKLIKKKFSAYYFLKVLLHHFSKRKVKKKSQNSIIQGFSYYFCLMIEGSVSRRPKNTWIRCIRIRNTAALRWLTIPALLHRKNLKGRTTRKMLHWKHWPDVNELYLTKKTRKTAFLELKKTRLRRLSFLALSAFWATCKLNWRTNEPKWSFICQYNTLG